MNLKETTFSWLAMFFILAMLGTFNNATAQCNPPNLVVTQPAPSCSSVVDLTSPHITAGSDAGDLEFFFDEALTLPVSNPSAVIDGTYYIRLTNEEGCSSSISVDVTTIAPSVLVITDLVPCNGTVDLRTGVSSSEPGVYEFFLDAQGTQAIADVTVASAGTYYVRLTNSKGCSTSLEPLHVFPTAPLTINYTSLVTPCNGTVDLRTVVTSPEPGTYEFFLDAQGTQRVTDETAVPAGTYYIRFTTAGGCSTNVSVEITTATDCTETNDDANNSEDMQDDSNTSIFDTYSWLNTIVNPTNCATASITVYQTGVFKYLLIDTGTEAKLYNEAGQLYCTNAANYDCVAVFNLTQILETWTCEANNTDNNEGETNNDSENDNTDNEEDNTAANSAIFDTYSWLNTVVNPVNCATASITVYQTGIFKYLLIDTGTEAKLYNEDGQLYCTNAANYDCLAAFNLTQILETWTCEANNTDNNEGETNNDSENDNTDNEEDNTAANSAIFDTYSWLSTIVNPTNCATTSITVYQTGIYKYLLIDTDGTEAKLYNEDGQLYCTNAANYDCVAVFNLTQILETWTCGQGLQQPTIQGFQKAVITAANLNVFPNPTTDKVFIQLPKLTQATQLRLIDTRGKILRSSTTMDANLEWNLSDLSSGLYLIQWQSETGIKTVRLVVAH